MKFLFQKAESGKLKAESWQRGRLLRSGLLEHAAVVVDGTLDFYLIKMMDSEILCEDDIADKVGEPMGVWKPGRSTRRGRNENPSSAFGGTVNSYTNCFYSVCDASRTPGV